jgi:signal transduction histidine kinase
MNLEDIAESVIKGRPLIDEVRPADENSLFAAFGALQVHDSEAQTVLEELLLNAREHGKNQGLRLFLSKHLGTAYFVIKDEGRGIHDTVPQNPRLSDVKGKAAAAIIRLACEEGVSGTGVRGRGIGLHLFSQFIKKRQGEGLVLSDGGLFVQVGDVFLERTSQHDIQGTLIALRWPL